ncbi:conjugative transposon protein TraJ [Bacteroides sp. 224]|uniref:conjugative transposon protein TraJ n=1 Tax=Bacteroides sp. 224 TaxID=2302936 RepID=UPI0013CF5471|nr:conjugative transposon protein TraJ [Bacteroides sp. 224]NDV64681.1 conjugative transposon protein TraJ [Bacteroides sp. 224]
MVMLAIDFSSLHEILRNLYMNMMPLCADMIGIAKGIAGLGALFYVAYRVWKSLASAEPIDVFPLLRPFAIGLCIMFFPTLVLNTINGVMSPVVQGTHKIMEDQMVNVEALQAKKDALEYDARVRAGKEWLVNSDEYDKKMDELGIRQLPEIVSMGAEKMWYEIKMWFRQLVRDFFELLYNAAGLTIDTLRTFFLIVLAILGPLAFAISIYDGFQSTLTGWISRYIAVYLWLPVSDIFSAVLSKIQELMLIIDITALEDPSYIPDESNGVYIIFMIIGIIGYFSIPTVSEWIIQAGGMGSATRGVNRAAVISAGVAGAAAGNAMGRMKNLAGSVFSRKSSGGNDDTGSPSGQNLNTQGGNSSGGYGAS